MSNKIYRLLAWVFGIIFLLAAVGSLFSNFLNAILFLLVSALLLPPVTVFIKKKWSYSLSRKTRIISSIVLLVILGIFTSSKSSPVVPIEGNTAVQTQPVTTTQAPPVDRGPLTIQQKLDNAVRSILPSSTAQFSFGTTTITNDVPPAPKGSQYVTVDINTGDGFWDGSSIITQSGQLASTIFQQVFPISSNFDDVIIRFYGPTTDQYGNTKDTMLLSYSMDPALYKQINWTGFPDTQNDIHLCAFLREQVMQIPQSERVNSGDGCVVMASNLRTAEDSIETSNPQFSDIPQYGQ